MAKTTWITPSELTDYLTGLGVTTIPTGIDLQDEIDGAVAMLEDVMGFAPALAGASATYNFDPPRSFHLDIGFFQSVTAVLVDAATLTSGVDYWPNPYNSLPYRRIQFSTRQYGLPKTISVTGIKGRFSDIPLNVWNAVRDYAASGVYKSASIAGTVASGTVSRVKQGMREVEYATPSGTSAKSVDETLKSDALKVFQRFRPVQVIGLGQ